MGTIKVLVADGMDKSGLEILKNTKAAQFELDVRSATPVDDLKKIIGGYDAIIVRSATTLTAELIGLCTSMKLIVRAGAGVDNIDVKAASAKKIPVMNTASANSLAAAEQTIALLFGMFRQVAPAAQSLKEGRWDRNLFKGYEVTGKTLGVVGLGNIGRLVVERAIGLKMKVIGFDPMIKSMSQLPSLGKFDESFKLMSTLDEVCKTADVITLHIPKVAETANLFNSDRLGSMKKGSFLINCSRGGIVDEKALIAALDSGQLAGAALDVFEKEPPPFPNPLFTHAKILCAPHLGASTFEAQTRVALTAAEQMIGFFSKGDRTGVVN